jgi:hypothetical protein
VQIDDAGQHEHVARADVDAVIARAGGGVLDDHAVGYVDGGRLDPAVGHEDPAPGNSHLHRVFSLFIRAGLPGGRLSLYGEEDAIDEVSDLDDLEAISSTSGYMKCIIGIFVCEP